MSNNSEITPARFIRKQFGLTQAQFGVIAGVSQGRVSEIEAGDMYGKDAQLRIIAEAKARGIAFSTAWFFEVPETAKAAAE